jgi:anti-sigma factor RsiW
MNITKNVITDLYPLYAENECSADTRALVEEYLHANPAHSEELHRIMATSVPPARLSQAQLDEAAALRKARRALRLRGTVMGFAIFFSLCPFSVQHNPGKTHWLFLESPLQAVLFAGIATALWVLYATMKRRSRIFQTRLSEGKS